MRIKNYIINWSHSSKLGNHGFSTLSSIIAISTVVIYALSTAFIISEQHKEAQKVQKNLTKLNLKSIFLNIFDNEICNCHLDTNQNISLPIGSSLTIDTTATSIDDIELGPLRSGCDFTSSDNIIVDSGKPFLVTPGFVAESVSLSQITPLTGVQGEYSANLKVEYKNEDISYKPFVAPLTFYLDLDSGTDSARPIEYCRLSEIVDPLNNENNDSKDCYYADGTGTHIGCGRESDTLATGTTSFGFSSGPSSSAIENTFIGAYSGKDNSLGIQNSLLGYKSGYSNTSGKFNINIGFESGYSNLGGKQNVFIGYQSGKSSTSSSQTISIGHQSGILNNATGNIFIGSQAGKNTVIGNKNTILGASSGLNNTGNKNTFFGSHAAETISSGDLNTCIGYMAGLGKEDLSSSSNISIGYQSGASDGLILGKNSFIGSFAGKDNTNGESNIGIGYSAGANNKSGDGNIFIGNMAGKESENSNENVSMGHQAGLKNNGNKNIFIGDSAGMSIENKNSNIFIGYKAGKLTKEGQGSIYIGYQSGENAAVGAIDIPNGQEDHGYSLVNRGNDVISIGANALENAKTNETIALGQRTAETMTYSSGIKNVFIGETAGGEHDTASNVVFIGYAAAKLSNGGKSVYIGALSGSDCSDTLDCVESVVIGGEAGAYAKGSYSTLIGYNTTGWYRDTSYSTILGSQAIITFNYNPDPIIDKILIGHKAAYITNDAQHNLFIGNDEYNNWLKGNISPLSSTLKIRNHNVLLGSSRALKKDIKPFTNFDKPLEDIIATPLFTYRYKGKRDFPEKERMGIIAEELPKHLQIKEPSKSSHPNDEPQISTPDWPSIYGSFWAAIKSLYQKIIKL